MSKTSKSMLDTGGAGLWRLDDRVAMVTGASAGLGARFARVLHQAGAHVLASRGRLDVLVNNAGICDDGPIEEQSLEELRRVIEVNLISVLDLCRLTAPLLWAAPEAGVINVASMFGIVASRGPMAAYNATKGALVNLTRQLAAQWGERGVRVNALAPGYFPTDLTGHLADADFARSIREHTLLGRTPALAEIDGPLLFLATPASSYMTARSLSSTAAGPQYEPR
jgi:NAD(P)-dependent dehydrogenase (short-subunit alcohol dehydrogenase family)